MSSVPTERASAVDGPGIKSVPQEAAVRRKVRSLARRVAVDLETSSPPTRRRLEELGRKVLRGAELEEQYLGFAMVAVSNAFWRQQYAAIPPDRRLVLLPHCLRDQDRCQGTYSPLGLHCKGCGACVLSELKAEAEALGYKVLIAEGTPAALQLVLSGRTDAILGVACLDSLEEAYESAMQLGVPYAAVALLWDGCKDTVADLEAIRHWMHFRREGTGDRTRSYLPLLRAAEGLFEDGRLAELLNEYIEGDLNTHLGADEPMAAAETMALDWLRRGGKRFRPFAMLASYAALARGPAVLEPDADLSGCFHTAVQKVAVAIEVLHKASLVHDDIEDDDQFRYGEKTLHRLHGVPAALNAGDYLIGLGYRLVGSAGSQMGSACAADILSYLAQCHLHLCRGQGAELKMEHSDADHISSRDVQAVYALKTAPAFEAAVYAGMRLAAADDYNGSWDDLSLPPQAVRRFSRYLGAGYQLLNDLEDWQRDREDKVVVGQDVLSRRPTLLRAFALEAGGDAARAELAAALEGGSDAERLDHLRRVYERYGVFEKARRLVDRYRQAARSQAEQVHWGGLRELLNFILETVL